MFPSCARQWRARQSHISRFLQKNPTSLGQNIPLFSTHGEDQTLNIWICRSTRFPGRNFEWWGLRSLTWKLGWIFVDSNENVFDMYGASREMLLEFWAVVIILSPISFVRGVSLVQDSDGQESRTSWDLSEKRPTNVGLFQKEPYICWTLSWKIALYLCLWYKSSIFVGRFSKK